MTYNESLEYINSLLRFGIKSGLERISRLCELLGSPQDSLQFIHVAGTNGKGSTCAYLSSIFMGAGYKTGMFTSPYVTDFRERFQINGELISKEKLCVYTERVRAATQQMRETPTEFEFITALAFLYFAGEGCDIVVLEVGLGGRFDATNIIKKPLCSVVTSIGLDHVAILGDTIEKIAYEKAGIIKKDCPVVCSGCLPDDAMAVMKDIAKERNSPMHVADKPSESPLKIRGNMQGYNAATAALAARISGMELTKEQIENGLKTATITARCEFLTPTLLLDGGHNPQAIEVLCDCIKQSFDSPVAMLGMMADKDMEEGISKIAPLCRRIYAVPVDNSRTATPKQIAEIASRFCEDVVECDSPSEAVKMLLSEDGEKVVCGSFYLAGEVRPMLLKN